MKKMAVIKREKEYCIEYIRYIYDDKLKRNKNIVLNVNEKKQLTNLARARREIIDIIKMNLEPGSCLLTLTYRENMNDYNKAYDDFRKFVMRVEYRYKMSLKYLRVIELQERGAIHFHVVVFNSDFLNIPYNEIYKIWARGAIHVRKIEAMDDVTADKIGNYLGKYLSKSKEIARNKNIYTTSRNLKRQKKERIIIEDEKLMELYEGYLKQLAKIVVYFGGSNMVKYIAEKNKKVLDNLKLMR